MRTLPRQAALVLAVFVLVAWAVFERSGVQLTGAQQLVSRAESAAATVLPTPTPAASAAAATPAAPATTSTASASPTAAASDAQNAAIQAAIQKANQEQQNAFAKKDPTLMKDTSAPGYYDQLVQTNQDLANSGVTAIKLVKLEWGPVTLNGADRARATTYETWQTTYDDGSTDQSRDRNVYTLVQDQGAWKIQTDDHPDSNLDDSGTPATDPSSPLPSVPGLSGGGVPPISRLLPGASDTSRNWSGYAATGGTYTAVSGTWTVPQSQGTTGTPGSASTSGRSGGRNLATGATWVGIGGVDSHDLIQAGTEETTTGNGRVHYDAWIELLPRPSHPVTLSVSPGDSVTVSIAQQDGDNWQVAFKDNTTGQTYQTTVQYQSSLSSAEWVEEAPSAGRSVLPLDNFGTIQFTNGSTAKDGKTDTLSQAGARSITMIDSRGNPIATPSPLSADGKGFSVTRSTSTSSSSPLAPGRRGSGAFPSLPGFPSNSLDPAQV